MLLNVLLGLLVLVCVCLVAVILLQRSEGGALGMGGTGSLLSTRGTGDLLTKTTQVLAAIFFILCLAITFMTGRGVGSNNGLDDIGPVQKRDAAPVLPKPALPAPPAGGGFQAPAPSLGGSAPAAPPPTAP